MSDVVDKKIPDAQKTAPTKPEHKVINTVKDADAGIQPHHKVGLLVEMILILLLVGIVFIFVFGMQQVKMEQQRELALRQKFEQVLPTFAKIAKLARAYPAIDEFQQYPTTLEDLNLLEPIKTEDINTEDFQFSFETDADVSCLIIMTTTKKFGKEGIKVIYDIKKEGKDAYEIKDPNPDVKPAITYDWLPS